MIFAFRRLHKRREGMPQSVRPNIRNPRVFLDETGDIRGPLTRIDERVAITLAEQKAMIVGVCCKSADVGAHKP